MTQTPIKSRPSWAARVGVSFDGDDGGGEMKALSILQPWAELIVAGHKPVENRTWSTSYRGPLVIHAGKRHCKSSHMAALLACDAADLDDTVIMSLLDAPKGGIVGVVDLVDITRSHESVFAADNYYHWVLSNPRRLSFMPFKGRLGLFDVEVTP